MLHLKGFDLLCTPSSWRFKCSSRAKPRPHLLQKTTFGFFLPGGGEVAVVISSASKEGMIVGATSGSGDEVIGYVVGYVLGRYPRNGESAVACVGVGDCGYVGFGDWFPKTGDCGCDWDENDVCGCDC